MFGIGLPEMILILALALIVVGPDKLPDLARSIAKGVMELKKTAEGLKDSLKEEGNPLKDVNKDLEDAAKNFKSHLLEHPDKGSTSLYPHEGVNPGREAANALSELKGTGIDTGASPKPEEETIDLTTDDLTEVVTPAEEERAAGTTDEPSAPEKKDQSQG